MRAQVKPSNYEISNLPSEAPPFTFSSDNISRRDLLRRIAEHWNLRMTVEINEAGLPKAVKVEG